MIKNSEIQIPNLYMDTKKFFTLHVYSNVTNLKLEYLKIEYSEYQLFIF